MNSRERFLLIAIGGMIGLAVLFGAAQRTLHTFKIRSQKIVKLEGDLRDVRLEVRRGQQATEEMLQWEQRSLPAEKEQAHSLYMTWLNQWVERHRLEDPNVKAENGRQNGEYYFAHTFTVSGRTDLRRLTSMLHDFYTAKQLHRVRSLTLTPVGPKTMDIYMSVDAMALPTAPNRSSIETDEALLAEVGPLADFEAAILERNLFGPSNNRPRLELRSSYDLTLGREFTLEVEAKDRDEVDSVELNADLEELGSARFRRGELSWTPRETGEFFVTFEAADDGIPTRMDRKEVRLIVKQAPPERVREEPKGFDWPSYTQLNGIVIRSGQPQAWLWVRPTDEKLRLGVGDSFQIGEVAGVMREIDSGSATFETDGKLFRIPLRGFVGKAEELGPAPNAVSAPASEPLAEQD